VIDPAMPPAKPMEAGKTPMKPVKILFLAANPTDQAPLRTDDERRKIDVEIIRSGRSSQVELLYESAIRRDALIDAMRRHRPDVVHFAGHGSSVEGIVLETEDGVSSPVDAATLAELFRLQGATVKLVLLNACYSRDQAGAIVRHVPCAIGMTQAIPDGTALSFATSFYQGLVQGESIQTAFESSLLQIGALQGSSSGVGPRELTGSHAAVTRPIPELIAGDGAVLSALRLTGDDPPGPDEHDGGVDRPAPLRKSPPQVAAPRPARRSLGLPIDRALGGSVGLALLLAGGVYWLLLLLVRLGSITETQFLPSWLWMPASALPVLGLLLLLPGLYRRSRLLRPEAMRLHRDNPDHFRGRDEDLECLLGVCRNHWQTCLVGESDSGKSTLVRMGLRPEWASSTWSPSTSGARTGTRARGEPCWI
jgi:hypothetical protein